MVLVSLQNTMMALLTRKPTTVATMIGVPQPTVEAVGQPTSTVVRCRPRRLTIAFEAGPRLSSSRLMTILTPTKPTPTVMPALKDLPIPMRKMSPTTKKMIGIITEALHQADDGVDDFHNVPFPCTRQAASPAALRCCPALSVGVGLR